MSYAASQIRTHLSRDVHMAASDQTILEAAITMPKLGIGGLPDAEGDNCSVELGETIRTVECRRVDVLGGASLHEYDGRMSSQIKAEHVTAGAAVAGMNVAENRAS